MQVESGMPAEPPKDAATRVLEVRGATPRELAASLVLALGEAFGADGTSEVSTVEQISGSGASVEKMLDALVDSVLATIEGASAMVVAAELSQVLSTEDGLRAWGYVWLGAPVVDGPRSLRAQPVRVTKESSGELRAILSLESGDARAEPSGSGR